MYTLFCRRLIQFSSCIQRCTSQNVSKQERERTKAHCAHGFLLLVATRIIHTVDFEYAYSVCVGNDRTDTTMEPRTYTHFTTTTTNCSTQEYSSNIFRRIMYTRCLLPMNGYWAIICMVYGTLARKRKYQNRMKKRKQKNANIPKMHDGTRENRTRPMEKCIYTVCMVVYDMENPYP